MNSAIRLQSVVLRQWALRNTCTSSSSSCLGRRSLHSTSVLWKDYPPHIIFSLPALSPTMETGTIADWALKPGDTFGAGDVICSIETDKATMDFEAQDDGILAKILKQGPTAVDVPCGSPICVIVEEASDVDAFADFEVQEEAAAPAAVTADADAASPAPAAPTAAAPSLGASTEHPMLPGARFLAESKGVDATGLQGTGKGGRITKGDVLLALANGVQLPPLLAKHAAVSAAVATPAAAAATSAPPATAAAAPAPKASGPDLVIPSVDTLGGYEDVANTGMRKIIAKRLTESKRDVPHFYASVEVELDNLLKLRKQLVTDHGVKVSVNDVIIRCASLALRDVPEVNATYDAKSQTVQMQDSIDISIAVATPAGLITPIVPKTDTLGLADIADKVRDLAGRAKEGKLKPEEYQGGTFCISNLGMFGIDEFSAVINPPQAAILAVGGGIRRIVPTPFVEGAEEQAKPTIKTIMTARLSADRRVVDEATVALFLSAFNHYISKPELLLL